MSIAGKANQVMLQGVHELYELDETPQVWGEEPRVNRLVFIGQLCACVRACVNAFNALLNKA